MLISPSAIVRRMGVLDATDVDGNAAAIRLVAETTPSSSLGFGSGLALGLFSFPAFAVVLFPLTTDVQLQSTRVGKGRGEGEICDICSVLLASSLLQSSLYFSSSGSADRSVVYSSPRT